LGWGQANVQDCVAIRQKTLEAPLSISCSAPGEIYISGLELSLLQGGVWMGGWGWP